MAKDMIVEEMPNFDIKSFEKLASSIPSYHRREDTLFFTVDPSKGAISYDIDGELWIRFDPTTKEIIGLEIEKFESVFLKKHPEMVKVWKTAKPHCTNKKARSGDLDVCYAFIRIILDFFSNIVRDNPQQSAFSPA